MQNKRLASITETELQQAFRKFKANVLESQRGAYKHAAVCIIVSTQAQTQLESAAHTAQPSVLMIRRAKHFGDPWSGHMAFPGGRIEAGDKTLCAGALRELAEELDVDAQALSLMGRLSDIQAHHVPGQRRLIISAFVFAARETLQITPNYEVAEYHWIPLSFFNTQARRKMWWFRRWRLFALPFYFYKRRRIWGLSLAMLDELFELLGQPLGSVKWRARYRHKSTKSMHQER